MLSLEPKGRRNGIKDQEYLMLKVVASFIKEQKTLKNQKYYLRKLAEGKAKKLVLNNVANKLIKIACAMLKSNSRYISTYRSVNQMCLISA